MKKWNTNSWTKFPAKHLPVYQDEKELDLVLSKGHKQYIEWINELSTLRKRNKL